ncbi:DUF3263 domain-containing protein [Rhodococcus fascians]|nr:DUF3263 domain-containing protein [Rhodococcus fascians]MBY4140930.1 DUF3263 domain-containing protein [Rhodococcus fascians]MBY4219594.1 DUF3263 domain-containing protein [Rhodococcus fascians]MBY4221903.1 DUF3263 domain-containing protein [Rhodococcus fascians]MBY4233904.1 DUF3263 domain-containing protein [Rhodococcus fascians]
MSTAQRQVAITNEARRMLDFASRWVHYGGGSQDDIFVEFGISSTTFFRRLSLLLDSDDLMPPEKRRLLGDVCERRMYGRSDGSG